MAIIDEQEREDQQNQVDDGNKVPELNQPTAPTAAPVAGGPSVGGAGNAKPAAPKGSSSGAFQDFSKFQAANKGKIEALGNLTTGGAQSSAQGAADNRQTALDTAGSKIKESYGNVNDFNNISQTNIEGTEGDNLRSTITDLGKSIDYTKGDDYGLQSATEADQAYGKAVGNIAGATDRTGVGQLLGKLRGGGKAAALAGDSLLLRGNQGFRQNMANTIGQVQQDFTDRTTGDNAIGTVFGGMADAAKLQRSDTQAALQGIQTNAADELQKTRDREALSNFWKNFNKSQNEKFAQVDAENTAIAQDAAGQGARTTEGLTEIGNQNAITAAALENLNQTYAPGYVSPTKEVPVEDRATLEESLGNTFNPYQPL